MTVVKAHFDGKVLVPDEPVDLPLNCALSYGSNLCRREDTPPFRLMRSRSCGSFNFSKNCPTIQTHRATVPANTTITCTDFRSGHDVR